MLRRNIPHQSSKTNIANQRHRLTKQNHHQSSMSLQPSFFGGSKFKWKDFRLYHLVILYPWITWVSRPKLFLDLFGRVTGLCRLYAKSCSTFQRFQHALLHAKLVTMKNARKSMEVLAITPAKMFVFHFPTIFQRFFCFRPSLYGKFPPCPPSSFCMSSCDLPSRSCSRTWCRRWSFCRDLRGHFCNGPCPLQVHTPELAIGRSVLTKNQIWTSGWEVWSMLEWYPWLSENLVWKKGLNMLNQCWTNAELTNS